MKDFSRKVMSFVRDEEGLTMVEYAVAGGLITAVTVVAFRTLGTEIAAGIGRIITAIQGN